MNKKTKEMIDNIFWKPLTGLAIFLCALPAIMHFTEPEGFQATFMLKIAAYTIMGTCSGITVAALAIIGNRHRKTLMRQHR